MHTEKTKDKGEKEKFTGFNCAPLGHGISEMMTKCCVGRGGFPDCSTVMEGMMGVCVEVLALEISHSIRGNSLLQYRCF